MGLDQYAYKGKTKKANDHQEIAYWRKHNRLEGFMRDLWIEKGRPDASKEYPNDFNCITIELTPDDIERLNEATVNDDLPYTEGFFFGADSQGYESYKANTLKFIDDAREAFKDGLKVFYYSNW